MRVSNTDQGYGAPAIALHWTMAVLVCAVVALGLYMVRLPDVGFNETKIVLILVHKEVGVGALAIAAVRLLWRLANRLPNLPETVPEWQQVAAVLVHLCFYALLFALPITGWVMSSAAGIPVSFLGFFTLPNLVGRDDFVFAELRGVHDWLGYAIAALVCLHAGAALRHHFVLRDPTLIRMLRSPEP